MSFLTCKNARVNQNHFWTHTSVDGRIHRLMKSDGCVEVFPTNRQRSFPVACKVWLHLFMDAYTHPFMDVHASIYGRTWRGSLPSFAKFGFISCSTRSTTSRTCRRARLIIPENGCTRIHLRPQTPRTCRRALWIKFQKWTHEPINMNGCCRAKHTPSP